MGAAQAADITGAGSTFVYPILSQWSNDYSKIAGDKVNYQSIGSGGGIAQIKAATVDFGASDKPLPPSELSAAGLAQFPIVVGAILPVVHINGVATRSCSMQAAGVAGRNVTTIEGLSPDGSHPVQQAWIEKDVPQCGYCQSGQIMGVAALLAKNAKPSDADIDEVMKFYICRCGTYQDIRAAIHRAAELQAKGGVG